MDKWLERGTNVAIIASTVLFAVVVTNSWRAQPSARQSSPRYSTGDSVADLDSRLTFSAAPRTVLLYLSSNCQFCVASVPFYRRLVAHRNQLVSPVQIVAIAKQPADVLERFLSENGIAVDKAVALSDSSNFKMNTTPAVLVVNRAGVIESLWVGQIPAGDEDSALRVVVAN